MKVLLAEDDTAQRERCAGLIAAHGHTVETAFDGQDALESLERFNPDLLVTDLRMPRVDGFELMKFLRSAGNLPPTIVLTAFGNVEMAIVRGSLSLDTGRYHDNADRKQGQAKKMVCLHEIPSLIIQDGWQMAADRSMAVLRPAGGTTKGSASGRSVRS